MSMELVEIYDKLGEMDAGWSFLPTFGDATTVLVTVNDITRSAVGSGADEVERFEDAFRKVAKMFGIDEVSE